MYKLPKDISKKTLNKMMNVLPKSIKKHSARCMKIADFLLKRIGIESWYLESDIKEDILLDCIGLHDIGKARVAKEYLFKDLCRGPADLKRYYAHIDEGLSAFNFTDIDKYIAKHPHSFKSYFFQVIKYHHANQDDMTLVGAISYIVDQIDNTCYKVASDTIVEFELAPFKDAMAKLRSTFAKCGVPEGFIELFANEEFVEDMFEYLRVLYNRSGANVHFGIKLSGQLVYDLFTYSNATRGDDVDIKLEDHDVFAKKISYNLNSRFYGNVKHNEFIRLAMKNKLSAKLDKYFLVELQLALEKNKLELGDNQMLFVSVALEGFSKSLLSSLSKLLVVNNINLSKVALLFDAYNPILTEQQMSLISSAKEEGYKIAINNVKSDYINLFKAVSVDYAFYDNFSTEETDKIFVELIQSLGVTIVVTKLYDKARYMVGKEKQLRSILAVKQKGGEK